MGYDVHITRKANWFDREGAGITIEEWKALIAGDQELRLDGHAQVSLEDGRVLRTESPGLAVWTSYSGHGAEGGMAWIDLRNGNLVVKNPDGEIIGKLWSIAEALNAKVQGDDGEHYDADGIISQQRRIPQQRRWWKFW